MNDIVDTSDEACAIACMLVSNPDGAVRSDGWQKRVNDLIRALRDERNRLRSIAGKAEPSSFRFTVQDAIDASKAGRAWK